MSTIPAPEALLDEALAALRRMVAQNSWTQNPAGVAQHAAQVAEWFAPLGFTAEMVPSEDADFGPHLVLTRQGSGDAGLAFIGHLDTVYRPDIDFSWQEEGDRIYGPGTNDIKGGTVMMWLVLQHLRAADPETFEATTWKLLFNSSEEEYSPDFGDLCRAELGAGTKAALVFEAEGSVNGMPVVVIARKGRATWQVHVRGRSSHAGSGLDRGVNAAAQLAHTVSRIHTLTDTARGLTFNVAWLKCETPLNCVPHEATAQGELRAYTPDVFTVGCDAIQALTGPGDITAISDGLAAQIEVNILTASRPWPPNEATAALAAHWMHHAEALGMPLGTQHRGGLSDGNQIWDHLPVLDGLGPAGDFAHCYERSADGSKTPEFVLKSSFLPKARLNAAAILGLLQR